MYLRSLTMESFIEMFLIEGVLGDFKKLVGNGKGKLFILAGSPRSGKSYTVSKYIKNAKVINPDDISLQFTKDPNQYHPGSSELSIKYLSNVVDHNRKDKLNLVYDVTGSSVDKFKNVANIAKKNGYDIELIQVFASLNTTLDRNKKADRHVDKEYLVDKWKQAQEMIKKLNKAIKPNNHFIVINDEKEIWYKYNGSKIVKR